MAHISPWFVQSEIQFPDSGSGDNCAEILHFALLFSANSAHSSFHTSFDWLERERRWKPLQKNVKRSHTENRKRM